jgi:DNA-binding response OmpR family regulator/cellulose synthase/poly-beta-1,6-N-acetylglucosamine synthase-like glycosyltransferase
VAAGNESNKAPIMAAAPGQSATPKKNGAGAASARPGKTYLLLVEDDADIRAMLNFAFKRSGYEVILAHNGREALTSLREALPDLIISDIMMPDMDGLELLMLLRADPLTRALPFILLTARESDADLVKGLGLGADDYIRKPFILKELLARVQAKLERPPAPLEGLPTSRNQHHLLDPQTFYEEAQRELERSARGGPSGCLAYLQLTELPRLARDYGANFGADITAQVGEILLDSCRPLDLVYCDKAGNFGLLWPETPDRQARSRLAALSKRLASRAFAAGPEQDQAMANGHGRARVQLTPAAGFTSFDTAQNKDELARHARLALRHAAAFLDLQPRQYREALDATPLPTPAVSPGRRLWQKLQAALALPGELGLVLLIGVVVPLLIYTGLWQVGFDISLPLLAITAFTLLLTSASIWTEGIMSLKPVSPPALPELTPPLSGASPVAGGAASERVIPPATRGPDQYPPASAIIPAYLPQAAPFIVEHLKAVLQMDYPGSFQVILAYHTGGVALPVEKDLQEMARQDPRLKILPVVGSTSRAQDINAALAEVRGEITGILESDQMPDPDSFRRAWPWLAGGYDLVQGHYLVRNGAASLTAQLVAIETEAVYAASLPGRSRLQRLSLSGGASNFWRTGVLREIRQRATNQNSITESALRVAESGYRVAYDPAIISHGLAPVSLRVIYEQQLRRAQSWFQLTLQHIGPTLRNPHLSFWQKAGLFYSLLWREISRWVTLQVFPLAAFFWWRDGGGWASPPFIALSLLYLLSVAPVQVLFTYRLAHPDIRRRKGWFLTYLLAASTFYIELKRMIARVGQVRELLLSQKAPEERGTLPEAELPGLALTEEEARLTLQVRSRVLVVEDDDDTRTFLSKVLETFGYQVRQAENGRQGLALVDEFKPHLIISDLNMPELDGLGFLKELRTRPATRAIPLILLTGQDNINDKVAGFGLGADDYITKPLNLTVFRARVQSRLERPNVPREFLRRDRHTGLMSEELFFEETRRELARSARSRTPGCLAYLYFEELSELIEVFGGQVKVFGGRVEAVIARQASELIFQAGAEERPLDLVGRDDTGRLLLLMPETDGLAAQRYLHEISRRLVAQVFRMGSEQFRLTPAVGFSAFPELPREQFLNRIGQANTKQDREAAPDKEMPEDSVARLAEQAALALDYALMNLDLQPVAFQTTPAASGAVTPATAQTEATGAAIAARNSGRNRKIRWSGASRDKRGSVGSANRPGNPWQILKTLPGWVGKKLDQSISLLQLVLSYIISFLVPLCLYIGLGGVGLEIASQVYILVVLALLFTSLLIWLEGFLALKPTQPPLEVGAPFPAATAIIAAYLPNEAATVVETVKAFLRLEYQGKLQIILAYNTPRPLPVEDILREISRQDRRFLALKVEGSTSKAQNVNAALSVATGEFTGVFDADHHPDPDSFQRAWRWLSNGYDVVQGHCLVRNGGTNWVTRLVAVEFEALYAVSHPGRARLHGFGIFGGSNGYWKTRLLHQIRMHGFMLTEDIDSSMRVVEAGYRVASDPLLISRELAPANLKSLWNQRMRWAQGWFQVSVKHIGQNLASTHLTGQQKLGMLHLLAWREIYPWISGQVLPIIVYWIIKYGGADRLDWLVPVFVLTTLFTFSTGPGQTLLAYRLADPQIKQHRRWFLFYIVMSVVFYTGYKNLIVRIAQIKEVMLERQWKVTPRLAGSSTRPLQEGPIPSRKES